VIAWYFMLRSGVHATVAGVVLGFLVPTKPLREELRADQIADQLENQQELTATDVRHAAFQVKESVPVDARLVDILHPWTSYVIIPIFALANAGVPLGSEALQSARTSTVAIGVFLGLVVGKTIGVFGAAVLAARAGVARLPRGVTLLQMLGIAMGAGIGFTVAIFVTGISLKDPLLRDQAKIGIFAASLVAAVISAITLTLASRRILPDELSLELEEAAEVFEHAPAGRVVPT
jgi:NhaA family Na+:H+ antiporter